MAVLRHAAVALEQVGYGIAGNAAFQIWQTWSG